MLITDSRIDAGKAFDWGRTSKEYARYRDIYPEIFYRKIVDRNLCVSGQRVLDLGTGTGVLPRNMYRFGADWVGTDISPNQIREAERLAAASDMKIDFRATSAEELDFPAERFDVITACQCFWYFDHEKITPMLARMLKKDGTLLILYMAWLPFEDEIAGASERLVLEYSPDWSGAREARKPIPIPDAVRSRFELVEHEEYDIMVPFTRASWHGRMKACRGVGASLSPDKLRSWDVAHRALLEQIAPEEFEVLHYAALAVLKKKAIP